MLRHDAPQPDGSSAWIDRCTSRQQCGTWYDPHELPALHPNFTHSALVDALYGSPRADKNLQLPCPRCEVPQTLTTVRYGNIDLDVCMACRGVWVDTAEYNALMQAMTAWRPGDASAHTTHYRAPAVVARMERAPGQWTRCVRCASELLASEATFTARGLMCVPCGLAWQRETDEA